MIVDALRMNSQISSLALWIGQFISSSCHFFFLVISLCSLRGLRVNPPVYWTYALYGVLRYGRSVREFLISTLE